jgi:hypothetical protein
VIRRLSELGGARNLIGYNSSFNQQVAAYTLTLEDLGKVVEINSSTTVAVTIPDESTVPFNIGDRIDILQTGAGQVSFAVAGSATFNSYDSQTKLVGQWAAATLIKRGSNLWVLVGNLTT